MIKPTLEDAFDVGRKEGEKEAFSEVLELLKVNSLPTIKIYLEARLRTLHSASRKNPFRREDEDQSR